TFKLDTSGVNDLIDQGEGINGRKVAYAGAVVLYQEVKRNVNKMGRKTGNLDRSIYHAYSDQSTDNTDVYHVSWNHKTAPHGHLLEYGHIQTHKVYMGKDGEWYTTKTPLETPKRVGARSFVRSAY